MEERKQESSGGGRVGNDNHGCEVTWMSHYLAHKSLSKCRVRRRGCKDVRHRNQGTTVVKSRGSDEVEPLYRHVDAGT